MYKTIIQKIQSILEGVTAVKSIYPYPLDGVPKAFPSVVFFPDTVENVYSTNTENRKKYKFKLWVNIDLGGTNENEVFTNILPNVVDKIIAEFDNKWSDNIDNHRAWLVIDSGQWGMSEENNAKKAYAELSLTYEVSNDI